MNDLTIKPPPPPTPPPDRIIKQDGPNCLELLLIMLVTILVAGLLFFLVSCSSILEACAPQYEDWQRYKQECYNDSTEFCGWETVVLTDYGNGLQGCDQFYKCRYVHKQPTFDGFMDWLYLPQYQTGGIYTESDSIIGSDTLYFWK